MEKIEVAFPIKDKDRLDEQKAVSSMMTGLNKLLELGAIKGNLDTILLTYKIEPKAGYAIAVLDKNCLVDGSKLNSVGGQLSFEVEPVQESLTIEAKQFSVASIQERLRINGMDPKLKFRYTVNDYKKYWKVNASKLNNNPKSVRTLKNMFIIDMMGIFSDVLPLIQEGRQLSNLTGLSNVTTGMNTVARELSASYKKALKSAKSSGISASVMKSLQGKYNEFMNMLITQIFPGIEEILSNETRTHSDTSNQAITKGTITIQTSDPDGFNLMLGAIKDQLEHDGNVSVKVGNNTFEFKGENTLPSIQMSSSTKEYSLTSEGRIKLF